MKKILFLVLMLTVAFSQFDNTIAGWYNEHYYVPEGSVYSEGLIVADESSLGSESLAETDFATHAFWTGTNDIDDTGGNAAYTWSANQTSTLTQIQAELATAGVGDRWYVFTYIIAVTTAFDGDGAATITTGFASSAVSLSLIAGTHTVYFKSKTTPVDFVISVVSGSDTEGTWTIDDVTLKQITGGGAYIAGDLTVVGNIISNKIGVFASKDASTTTTVTTAGTYYAISGAFTNLPMETFIFDTDHIEYTGTETIYFELDWHATISGDSNGMTVTCGIFKNSVIVGTSKMETFLKIANEEQALAGTCVIELATNDEIQLVLTADGNGDIVTVDYYTTSMRPFFQ